MNVKSIIKAAGKRIKGFFCPSVDDIYRRVVYHEKGKIKYGGLTKEEYAEKIEQLYEIIDGYDESSGREDDS